MKEEEENDESTRTLCTKSNWAPAYWKCKNCIIQLFVCRHNDGDFIIRIEDTDQKRNIEDGEKSQLENLAWLGMNWDESPENPGEYGPYRQSERKEIYQPLIDQLLASNRAYKCYCTEEELEA